MSSPLRVLATVFVGSALCSGCADIFVGTPLSSSRTRPIIVEEPPRPPPQQPTQVIIVQQAAEPTPVAVVETAPPVMMAPQPVVTPPPQPAPVQTIVYESPTDPKRW